MTKVCFVLPDQELERRDFQRFQQSFIDNFGDCLVEYTGSSDGAQHNATKFNLDLSGSCMSEADHVVGVIDRKQPHSKHGTLYGLETLPHQRRWHFNLTKTYLRARLEPEHFDDYEILFPHANSHAFNKLGSKTTDQFIYFPYGYTFRMIGLGPMDEFGLRIPDSTRSLASRPNTEKLILYFGGSAAWSLDCLFSEMLTSKLQILLNERARESNSDLSYRVLNMGQHGNVVLNEMLTYLLFGESLRPDVVIAHDGFNDMIYGVSNDTRLIGHHRIAYQDVLEQWPMLLHGTAQSQSTYYREKISSLRNSPEATVRAYIERKMQFERIVNSTGAEFIWGLQPCLASKEELHDFERDYLELDKPYESQFGNGYANMKRLLDDVSDELERLSPKHSLNNHQEFASAGQGDLYFADYVHCSPEGDARMAQTYCNYLSKMAN